MRRSRGGREGYILVAVLAVVVVLTGLIAAGAVVVRSALGTVRVDDADFATSGLLSGGMEIAAFQLSVLKIAPDLVDGRRIRLSGGVVTPHVVDEASKVDLNAANPKLLNGVLMGVGMDEATAEAVTARIVEVRGPPNGAIPNVSGIIGNGTAPSTGGPPARPSAAPPGSNDAPPRRRGLQSVEDLSDFEGVRAGDMRLLRQRLTVYNPDGRINVMTAAPEVLGSMPGMTKLKLTQVLAARDGGGKDAGSEAQAALGGELASFTKAMPGPAFTVRIDAEVTNGRKKSVGAIVAASKSPNQPYYILDWRD